MAKSVYCLEQEVREVPRILLPSMRHKLRCCTLSIFVAFAFTIGVGAGGVQLKARPPHDAFKRLDPAKDVKIAGKLR